ncbi:MAG: excinuclease ABC subunit UvrC [Chloroflexota bacterium]|nr:excinuclease ABC subunit UvrC [Chloroflexota bacterium]
MNLVEIARGFPDKSGVYIFKDQKGNPVYVGKASRLSHRIRAYFGAESKKVGSKNSRIYHASEDLDYIVTGNEAEALILENTLIKKHQPIFNIRLKDGKSYPYLKIDTKSDWPRVTITRDIKEDGSKYFGPYFSASSLRRTMDLVNKLFPYRSCTKVITGTDPRPCLDFHINRCLGPCIGAVDKQDYMDVIDQVISFLQGKHSGIIKELNNKMDLASKSLKYEQAAVFRDQIEAIEHVTQEQNAASQGYVNEDIIALARDDDEAWVEIFFLRNGQILGKDNFLLEGARGVTDGEVLSEFLKQFYSNGLNIPRTILTEVEVADSQLIADWLETKTDSRRVNLKVPKRGEKLRLIRMVAENAVAGLNSYHLKNLAAKDSRAAAIQEITEELNLPNPPQRIECYDISNIQGTDSVGSMVVFENGLPKKSHYRRFKIKTVSGPNDFASLQEVILRRFTNSGLVGDAATDSGFSEQQKKQYMKDMPQGAISSRTKVVKDASFNSKPDLILIDGGKGQLNAVAEVMRLNLGIHNIPVASLAKKREEIFVPHVAESILLPRNSNALYLVQRIRDEAHRFAITFHRKLRSNRSVASQLDLIPGIGPTRKKYLIKYFGSISKIRAASAEEIKAVPGMSEKLANTVKEYI